MTVFRTRDLPPVERLDALRHWVEEEGFAGAPVDARFDAGRQVDAEFRTGAVGVLNVVAARTGSGEIRRTTRHIRRSDPELYKIIQATEGTSVIEQDGQEVVLGPGDFALLHTSAPVRWHYTAGAVAVAFSRTLLPRRRHRAGPTALRLSDDDGIGVILSRMIARLPDYFGRLGPGSAARLSSAVIDLVGAAVAERLGETALPPDTGQRALLLRIHVFIEERLGDPELSPAAIAAAHFISTRYLYKLFQSADVGVADWIRQRRLERCRTDLVDPATRDLPVSAVGARWGLSNPAHFNRIFRDNFGVPPGEFRRMWAPGMSAPDCPE
jgi:AraC-like DNA-binding protein